LTATRPYRSIEHPQAWLYAADAAAIELSGTDAWVKYAGNGLVLEQQSGDAAGQSVSTNGSTITIGTPGMWRVRLTCSYSSESSLSGDDSFPVTLDRSSLDEPTTQALAEGAEYTLIGFGATLAFERIIHVDSSETLALFAYLDSVGEGAPGTLSLGFVSIEVEYIGPPSYPLPGFWDVNWSDMVVGANVLDSGGDPAADGEGVTTWLRREGSADWVVRGTQATMEVDGYDSLTPGLAFPGAHAGYEIDSEAGSFSGGDPPLTFAAIFDIATPSLLNNLLSLVDSANDFYLLIGENGSAYRIQRTSGSPSTRTAGTVTAGTHWIVVRRNPANGGTVSVWVDDPETPIINELSLGGGTFTPDSITLGSYHGSVDSVPTEAVFHGAGLSTGLISQAGVRRFAEHVARWGYV
jgi:hypothetical protein